MREWWWRVRVRFWRALLCPVCIYPRFFGRATVEPNGCQWRGYCNTNSTGPR